MYFSYVGDFCFHIAFASFPIHGCGSNAFIQAHVEQGQNRPSGAADEDASNAAYLLRVGSFTLLYVR
jgi:hypothetical protein